jgi:hypothetical protein
MLLLLRWCFVKCKTATLCPHETCISFSVELGSSGCELLMERDQTYPYALYVLPVTQIAWTQNLRKLYIIVMCTNGNCIRKVSVNGIIIKMRTFLDIVSCYHGVYRHFRCVLPPSSGHHPIDGGSTYLWNVGLLRDYTALYPRKLSSSYSLPWELEISHGIIIYLWLLLASLYKLRHVKKSRHCKFFPELIIYMSYAVLKYCKQCNRSAFITTTDN